MASATVCQASASSTVTTSAVSGPETTATTALAWVGWISSRTRASGAGDVTKRCSPCTGMHAAGLGRGCADHRVLQPYVGAGGAAGCCCRKTVLSGRLGHRGPGTPRSGHRPVSSRRGQGPRGLGARRGPRCVRGWSRLGIMTVRSAVRGRRARLRVSRRPRTTIPGRCDHPVAPTGSVRCGGVGAGRRFALPLRNVACCVPDSSRRDCDAPRP
ncbi:hypothetical protein EF908_14075 [Streptomyces sp. WAC04770]|nr:hypothetical protein EF908_14075 [Streptomyces sp. WAC04770]